MLHLIDSAPRNGRCCAADAVHACRALIRHAPGFTHEVCIIGGSALARLSEAAGLRPHARVSPAMGMPALASRAVERLLEDRGRPDVIQCYSEAAVGLARRVGDASGRVLLCLEGPGDPRARAGTVLLTVGRRAREAWIAAGADPARVEASPPPVEAVDVGRRGTARASLNIEPEEVVIAPVGSGTSADALRCAFVLGLLTAAAIPVTLLLPPGITRAQRARGFIDRTGHHPRILRAGSQDDLLLAADIGFWDEGGAGPTAGFSASSGTGMLQIARAYATGLPVVAPGWTLDEELCPPDVREASAGLNSTLPEVARIILRLVDDPGLRRGLAARVREHAIAARWGRAAAEVASRVWRSAAGAGTIGVPAPAPLAV